MKVQVAASLMQSLYRRKRAAYRSRGDSRRTGGARFFEILLKICARSETYRVRPLAEVTTPERGTAPIRWALTLTDFGGTCHADTTQAVLDEWIRELF